MVSADLKMSGRMYVVSRLPLRRRSSWVMAHSSSTLWGTLICRTRAFWWKRR